MDTVPNEDPHDSGLAAVNNAVVHGEAVGGRILLDLFVLVAL